MSATLDKAIQTFDGLYPNYHSEVIQWTPKGTTESQPAVKIIRYQGDKGVFLSTSLSIAVIKGMAEVHTCAEKFTPAVASTPATPSATQSLTDTVNALKAAGFTKAEVKERTDALLASQK